MYKIIGADGGQYGPVPAEQLRQWIAEGRANAQTQVIGEGAAEWKPLGTLPEFSNLFAPPPVTPAPIVAPQIRRTNSAAMTGMILGILSLTFCLCCYGFPCNVLGIIFSVVGLAQAKNSPHLYDGKGMAVAGLILSILSIILSVFFLILGLAFGGHGHNFRWEVMGN